MWVAPARCARTRRRRTCSFMIIFANPQAARRSRCGDPANPRHRRVPRRRHEDRRASSRNRADAGTGGGTAWDFHPVLRALRERTRQPHAANTGQRCGRAWHLCRRAICAACLARDQARATTAEQVAASMGLKRVDYLRRLPMRRTSIPSISPRVFLFLSRTDSPEGRTITWNNGEKSPASRQGNTAPETRSPARGGN